MSFAYQAAMQQKQKQDTINQQNQVALDAYKAGKITQSQYNEFIANNGKTPTNTTAPLQAMPSEPAPNSTGVIKDPTGTWVGVNNNNAGLKNPLNEPSGLSFYPASLVREEQNDPTMQNVVIPSLEVSAVAVGAVFAPEIVLPAVAIGEAANIGINSAVKSFSSGTPQLVLPTTVREVTDTAVISAGFGLVGAGVIGGAARIAPQLVGEVANPWVASATRISLNTGLGAGGGALLGGGKPEAILQGAGFGAAFGLGGEAIGAVAPKVSPYIPRLKLETPSFTEDYAGSGKLLTLYSGKNPEPNILAYGVKSEGGYKIGVGTPKVSPEAYALPELNMNYESPFKSPVDVKIYSKGLETYKQPLPEIEVFKGGKALIYESQKTVIPKADIPKTLTIQTARDEFIGPAAVETLKAPEFKGDIEYYGSSSFNSIFKEFRLGKDIDIQNFQTQDQLNTFATKLAGNANKLSGTNEYLVQDGNIFRNGKGLTDLHFKDQPTPTGSKSGASSSFGLKSKAPLKIENVNVMDPTELTIAKGSSSLTPRSFKANTTASDFDSANPTVEYESMAKYIQKIGKQNGDFFGSAPAGYRGKDVTDFLATSKILNERYWNGKQTGNINNLIDIYTDKGFTTPEKVNVAAGKISETDLGIKLKNYQMSLPKIEQTTKSFASKGSASSALGFNSKALNASIGSTSQKKSSKQPTSQSNMFSTPSMSLPKSSNSRSNSLFSAPNIKSNSNSLLSTGKTMSLPIFTNEAKVSLPSISKPQKTQSSITSNPKLFSPPSIFKKSPTSSTSYPKSPGYPKSLTSLASQRSPNKGNLIPSFGMGGGNDFLKPQKFGSADWKQKRHKIKTYSQMLNTFGVGKVAKPLRKFDRAVSPKLNKLDKATSKLLTKTFKPKQQHRKRR
jgi:hypothetical protein